MTPTRRLLAGFWPLLLLALFIGTFRRTVTDAGGGASLAECDQLAARPEAGDTARIERCLALDPSNASLLVDLGRAADAAGRAADAERLYVRALGLDPSNSDLHVRLGELLIGRGDAQAARGEALAALRWRPNGAAASRLLERASAAARTP